MLERERETIIWYNAKGGFVCDSIFVFCYFFLNFVLLQFDRGFFVSIQDQSEGRRECRTVGESKR